MVQGEQAHPMRYQSYRISPFTGSELDPILNEIDKLFGFGFYYSAIAIALSLPDICASLEIEATDEWMRYKKAGERYKPWCAKYFVKRFSNFTAEDCWALRGSVIHNAQLHGHPQLNNKRIIFVPPYSGSVHDCVSMNSDGEELALILDIKEFCHEMVAAVQEWFGEKKADTLVRDNMKGLVRTHPRGIDPLIVGVPVVA